MTPFRQTVNPTNCQTDKLPNLPDPPPPPESARRVRLYAYQWIGLGILALLPLLASFGVFGVSFHTWQGAAGAFQVSVTYPDRLRYWQLNQIEVFVTNTSAATASDVRIALDSAFVLRFADVSAEPEFDAPFALGFDSIPPRASRAALIELRADRYGRHSGTLTVAAGDTLRVPLAITVFP